MQVPSCRPRLLLVALAVASISCGGTPTPAAGGPAPAGGGTGPGSDVAGATGPAPAAAKPVTVPLEEAEAAQVLGPDAGKLTQLANLAPKTHAAVLKGWLWKPVAECEKQSLVPVETGPGILLGKGDAPKIRADAYAKLKEAGALAKQRGTAIEVVSGQVTVAEAVKTWNQSVLEAALAEAKAASPGDRKDKNLMTAAKKRLVPDADPKEWSASACETGRAGGASVVVQLIALDAGGGRGAVLVKGGAEADRFDKGTYETTYWDKEKGKNYRTLTEIMSAGSFVRQCSEASRFTFLPDLGGTWRCREGGESWEPENRPIPAWK